MAGRMAGAIRMKREKERAAALNQRKVGLQAFRENSE